MRYRTAAAAGMVVASTVGLGATPAVASAQSHPFVHASCMTTGKEAWPELVGSDATKAATTIEKENPSVETTVVPEGSMVTSDFRCDRVRVFTKPQPNTVAVTPRIG